MIIIDERLGGTQTNTSQVRSNVRLRHYVL